MIPAKQRLLVLALLIAGILSPRAFSADCPPGYLLAQNTAPGAPKSGLKSGPTPRRDEERPGGFIDLPTQPSAPPQIGSDYTVAPIGCDRQFRVGGAIHPLDSHHRRDAENLRPFLEGVPQAVDALNAYQRNKRKARFAAYTGTVGLLGALATFVLVDRDEKFFKVGILGGLGVLGASLGYSLAVTQANEENVARAVNIHNRARPERKIELLYRTEL